MPEEIVVSILVSTHNRAEDLRATLESVATCDVPADLPTEFIAIDNASSDETAKLLVETRLPNMVFRPLREPKPGKSGALNMALGKARGKILLFSDDDLRLPRNWIDGMCRPILEGRLDAVIGGVKLAPHLERVWLTGMKRSWLAITDEYDGTATTMIGANMALGRQVFDRIGGFDTELGPGAWVAGDDVLLSWQVKEAGFRIGTALDVAPEHHLHESRLSRATFLKRAFMEGQQEAYLYHHWLHGTMTLPVVKKWVRQMQLLAARVRRQKERRNPEGAPDWELDLLRKIGFCKQYAIERRRPRNYAKRGLRKLAAPVMTGGRGDSGAAMKPAMETA